MAYCTICGDTGDIEVYNDHAGDYETVDCECVVLAEQQSDDAAEASAAYWNSILSDVITLTAERCTSCSNGEIRVCDGPSEQSCYWRDCLRCTGNGWIPATVPAALAVA